MAADEAAMDALRWHRVELPHTYAARTIRMPDSANLEAVSAKVRCTLFFTGSSVLCSQGERGVLQVI